jgi:hypothetical protein
MPEIARQASLSEVVCRISLELGRAVLAVLLVALIVANGLNIPPIW